MKLLMITADDLGADEGRNGGIFETIQAGIVTGASILANGPALQDALRCIRALESVEVSFGVHLNLSEGRPICSGLRLLAGPHGDFLGKAAAHRLCMREGDHALETELARELDAQVEALLDSGIRIGHLDGHQHVHVFPAVLHATMATARRHNIPWVRVPEEPDFPTWAGVVQEGLAEEARAFSRLARIARPQVGIQGLATTDSFLGLYLKDRLSPVILKSMCRSIPEGLTELMVHPGRTRPNPGTGPFSVFSIAHRERELEALLDPGFRLALRDAGVVLTPFPEVSH
jgi:predicted glycoside hydrolase/deacetylase ChbG (UPF0249 family)